LRQDPSSTFDSQLAVMEKMQTQFRNCFAVIIIDLNDNTTWDRIQLKLKGGLLRLFAASTFETTSSIILDYYKLMKNSSKLQQQSSFFEKVMSNISFQILCVTIPLIINSITISFFVICIYNNISSPNTAATITQETLDRIGIRNSEVNMLMDSLPSIKELISADLETLQDVPIDMESLQAVEQFFSIDTTSA